MNASWCEDTNATKIVLPNFTFKGNQIIYSSWYIGAYGKLLYSTECRI